MEISDKKKEALLACAERTLRYTNLLIAQCDSWLSAEEGNKEMKKRMQEREKKKRRRKIGELFGIGS